MVRIVILALALALVGVSCFAVTDDPCVSCHRTCEIRGRSDCDDTCEASDVCLGDGGAKLEEDESE